MHGRKNGQRYKEYEKDVEQLWGGLFEDLPIRGACIRRHLHFPMAFRFLLRFQFMVPEEFLQIDIPIMTFCNEFTPSRIACQSVSVLTFKGNAK